MKIKKFMRISKNPINGQKNKVNNVFGIKNLLVEKSETEIVIDVKNIKELLFENEF
jgi:hypothetical protein